MQSHNVIGSNTQKIARLFPNCVTERLGKDGKPELAIDFEKLQAELSNEIIAEGEERYQFTWPDKRASVRLANTPTTMTLRPCREESVDFDNTQNLYIEGDNLDVLKVLRETYLGKVKMIYIDPPYNTGNDFVYNDDFAENAANDADRSFFRDEEGNIIMDEKVYTRNTESNGRFHTDWLNMIYPRLKVARDLLSEDGVVFISIDENEVENLKKICNEIYGERNAVGTFIWRKKDGGGQAKDAFVIEHEYILVYKKSDLFIWFDKVEARSACEYNKSDDNGIYKITKLAKWGNTARREDRPSMYFPIEAPDETLVFPVAPDGGDGRWRVGKPRMNEIINSNLIHWELKNGNWIPYEKEYFANQSKVIKERSILYSLANTGDGSNILTSLFGRKDTFENPKPVDIIKLFAGCSTTNDSLILDFFSGSATTAHAVMKLNAEDGGNRKFIMVQLPEKTDEKSEAYKAGYKNICEIGKERIRRAGRKINEELGVRNEKLDIGFRVLKLDSSNMEDVYYTPKEFSMNSLFNENVKSDRTNEDLLFQVMLDLGIELSVSIRNEELGIRNDITVFNVDDGYLMAVFDKDVDEKTITEIAKRKPVYFVMRDASASNDNVIDNFEQIFKHYSPETTCRVI